MTAPTPSILTLIGPYTEAIAFAAGKEPAITASEFISQLAAAAHNLKNAGIRNTVNLDNAATHLSDALSPKSKQEVSRSLTLARHCLQTTADLVGEYRPLA